MNPVIFNIGNFELRWYSVLIAIAVIIGYVLIINESRRFKIKKEFMFNMMFWTLIFAIIGARLYYVAFNLEYYRTNILEIFQIWKGGLAIHGALLFGAITIIIYCKKYKVRVGKILDIIVPALLLGQAIGRWGNFFNSEAYGSIVTYQQLENMKIIPQFIIDNMFINGSYHLPMFYFESLWCLLGFFLSLFLRRRKYIKDGQLVAFYMMWYGVARFVIETFRTDALLFNGIRVARVVSVLMFVIGLIIQFIQSRKPKLDELYNKAEEEVRF
ncbi:MAG: prolipoprotein diacylglyceryl transferase [Bacilli bacterium]